MIIDLQRFVSGERPYWTELESMLPRLENHARSFASLEELRRFHYLYERTAAGLARVNSLSTEPETRRYLESLVARAYGEVHETRDRQHRVRLWSWFFETLPQTFRRHVRAFYLSVAITLAGCAFGAFATMFDPDCEIADHRIGSSASMRSRAGKLSQQVCRCPQSEGECG